jgi:hypothetical protein
MVEEMTEYRDHDKQVKKRLGKERLKVGDQRRRIGKMD